jgi:hypothetical protein
MTSFVTKVGWAVELALALASSSSSRMIVLVTAAASASDDGADPIVLVMKTSDVAAA